MGEVYRAHDLVLGQQVALKFLPESLSKNPSMIARFYSEVRVARQVSHPNVCRVYDIGEIDGMLYLSMEYVNGEDLGSLLRRIGRLPSDKAAEIARKICAGLAAAHEKGILHRDLKPANIMLDGSGQISIMDFGLAGVAAQITGAEIRNGTPAYMAPEQLAGREVTIRSDIYALGLVLYEIFTGKRPFDASSLAELMKMQESGTPVSISSVVRDLDPAVEKVIVRCLSPDPKDRPASALLVAAALPGGDPIAAALAAGETPSPQLIAASGTTEGMRPRIAVACLVAVVVGLIASLILGTYANAPVLAGLDYPPDVLQHKARELALKLGYAKPNSAVASFEQNANYTRYAARNRIMMSQPHGPNQRLSFWVRESPTPLLSNSFMTEVNMTYPAFVQPDMRRMMLDSEGDLISFEAVPPAYSTPENNTAVDWKPVFDAAGVNPARFTAARPIVRPSVPVDQLSAWWTGYDSQKPDARDVLVEAGSWRGKVVYFNVVPSWALPKEADFVMGPKLTDAIQPLIFFSVVGGACLLARYNLRKKRADKPGAWKLAQFGFCLTLTGWMFGSIHSLGPGESDVVQTGVALSALLAGLLYILYIALEPWVRRLWPRTMVGWSRVVTGHPRDPKVGTDLLIGAVWGVGWGLLYLAHNALFNSLGWQAGSRLMPLTLSGGRFLVESSAAALNMTMQIAFILFFIILTLKAVLRKEWLTAVVFCLLWGGVAGFTSYYFQVDFPFFILIYALFVGMLIRFGLLCNVIGNFCYTLIATAPVTMDLSAWYSFSSVFPLLLVLAVAIYGFRTTMGGRSILKADAGNL